MLLTPRGPGSSVGIATGYGLDGPGSNPGEDEISRNCPDRPWGPPSLLYNGYCVFPGVKSSRGVTMTTSLPSSAVVKKEYSYMSNPPMRRTACTEPQCLTRVNFTFTYIGTTEGTHEGGDIYKHRLCSAE